jgi:MoaA/NifB/PqqE/SkfB family radical SAM enzyme
MIISVTRKCNLRCRGCYSHVAATLESAAARPAELDGAAFSRVVAEASALGVSFALLAGGEPLTRAEEIFSLARHNPNMIFPVFTNGTLIDDAAIAAFRKNRNLIPVISLEGGLSHTDGRRGNGVYGRAEAALARLHKAGVFFGLSFTVTRENAAELTSPDFILGLNRAGAGVFFYNEYTPIAAGTEGLCLDERGRGKLLADIQSLRSLARALFLAFPGEEDRYGGCLSAGRGFVHVAPDGKLEACPFAPFGDTSARELSLREALASPTLQAIREHHAELAETAGGCALWDQREWVEGLVAAQAER